MRRFLLLGIAVLLVLARAAINGTAAAPARAERAEPPSYWEAIIQGRIRP